jgi:hypothetical protein
MLQPVKAGRRLSSRPGKFSYREETGTERQGLAERNEKLLRYLEKWNKTSVGTRLDRLYEKNKTKAFAAANAIEQQARHLRQFDETTIKSQFKTTPENVLRIVRIGAANRNRGEYFTEWPLTTPDDAIYFVDTKYGATLRGVNKGDLMVESSNTDYASEVQQVVAGTGNGFLTTFSGTLFNAPIVPFKTHLIVGGAYVASDDGNGKWVGSSVDVGNVASFIDYTTGAWSVVMNAPVPVGKEVRIEYSFDAEVESNFDQYGLTDMTLRRQRFNARIQPLGYIFSKMVQITLDTTGIGEAEEYLIRRAGDEHAKRQDLKAIQWGKRIALTNPVSHFNTNFADEGSDNAFNHAQEIYTKIRDIGGAIYDSQQRGEVTRIVGGSGFVTYLTKHRLWQSDKSQKRIGGTYLAGHLDGIPVFQAVSNAGQGLLDRNEGLLIYKNPDEDGDISLAFGVMTELHASLEYPQFYKYGNIGTVEDRMVINSHFIRMLVLDNLPAV